MRNSLNKAYYSANNLYWQGQYEEVCNLSPFIDRLCGRLLRFVRFIIILAGLLVGGFMGFALSNYKISHRIYWYLGVVILVSICGAVLSWYMTHKDAKREIMICLLLSTISVVSAIGIGERIFFSY